ncbi:MAG: GNAT family N-acetyltransferase [Clostridiales bacterium]|nr:GNAT family N-acetyltransferase [Clostridiales bacterium]
MNLVLYDGNEKLLSLIANFLKEQIIKKNGFINNIELSELEKSNFDNIYLHPNTAFWCVMSEDKIVGTLALRTYEETVAELKRFYVVENSRGNGIGLNLLYLAISFAQKNMYSKLRAAISESALACQHLLEKEGFVKTKKYRESQAQLFYEKDLKNIKDNCYKVGSIIRNSLMQQEVHFNDSLILNPVENIPFDDTLYPATSFLHGLYNTDTFRTSSQKYNTKIQFSGRDTINKDVNMIYDAWALLLKAKGVTMRLLSGLHAHIILFMSIAKIGDRVLLLPEEAGGHYSTLKILERLGLEVKCLPIDIPNRRINKITSLKLIEEFKPKFIFIDRSEGLIFEDFSWIKENTDDIYKIFDASQYLTNIIAGDYVNPFDMGFDLILSTTHKNLPGPQMALIATKETNDNWFMLKSHISTFVSNMHVFNIYTAGLMLNHYDDLIQHSQLMLQNTFKLETALLQRNVPVVQRSMQFSEPMTHHIWINTPSQDKSFSCFLNLEKLNINVNYRLLPYNLGYGLRLGLSGATRMGLHNDEDIVDIADIIAKCYKDVPVACDYVKHIIRRIKKNDK